HLVTPAPSSVTSRLLHSTPPATTEISTLSLHDALPISRGSGRRRCGRGPGSPMRSRGARGPSRGRTRAGHGRRRRRRACPARVRSEEHTSELQSPDHLVCRLLLEKKKRITTRMLYKTRL